MCKVERKDGIDVVHCEGAGAGRAGRIVGTGVAINVSTTAVVFEVLAARVVHGVAVFAVVGVAVGLLPSLRAELAFMLRSSPPRSCTSLHSPQWLRLRQMLRPPGPGTVCAVAAAEAAGDVSAAGVVLWVGTKVFAKVVAAVLC